MVKPLQRAEIKTFSGGLKTEAPKLQFPENASQDELNFDIGMDGSRFRRLGFDIEPDGLPVDTGFPWQSVTSVAQSSYLWEQVGGIAGKQFLVIQLGNNLYFFDPTATTVSDTPPLKLQVTGVDAQTRFGMASVEGMLVLVSGVATINVISYSAITNSLTSTQGRIRIRDVYGLQETLDTRYEDEVDYRGPLNWQHYYNLYNQGWAIPRYDWQMDVTDTSDAVNLGMNKGAGPAPSNADTVWLGLQERSIAKEGSGAELRFLTAECFHYLQYKGLWGSGEQASRGFFIIDAFNRGTSRATEWNLHKTKYPQTQNLVGGGMPFKIDQTVGGPTTVAEHAGRVFYSGCKGDVIDGDKRSPNFANYVFFSCLVRSERDFYQCYQDGDPTSRDKNDLIDTDGGFFKIAEAKNIMAMFSMGPRLIVLAENGVWAVTGGSDYGFTATNYKVSKISTYGLQGPKSIVLEGSTAYYWGAGAIYQIGSNQMGDPTVEDISTAAIRKFYNEIGADVKAEVVGGYDKYSRRISWMYHPKELNVASGVDNYELIYDLNFQAFIPLRISSDDVIKPFIVGSFASPMFAVEYETAVVLDTARNFVVTTDGRQIGGRVAKSVATTNNTKYIGMLQGLAGELSIFFGTYWRPDFRDWKYLNGTGTDAAAYILTGDITAGDAAIKKQVPYLTMFMENTEDTILDDIPQRESSCLARMQWDFTDGIQSGRWSREMQLYRRPRHRYSAGNGDIYTGETLVITKSKMRGNGKAFAMHLSTEPDKDLRIVGWSLSITANGVA